MKKAHFRLICAFFALCLIAPVLAGCADGLQQTAEPDYSPMKGGAVEYLTASKFEPDRKAGKVSAAFREAYADFALNLLNESRSEFEGDALLVSPLSAMIALAMTANGANGDTLREMEKVLGGGMSIENLSEQLFNYTASLISTEDAKFNLANAVWVTNDKSFSINKNFVKIVENTFDADIVAADLPNSIKDINDWAKKETFGMIPSILNEGDLDADTVMVLLNALALDALWAKQADSKYECFEGEFRGIDESIQKVTYMHTKCEGYVESKNSVGVVKSYKGGNYAFLAFLPEGNVYEYAASLSGKDLLKLYDNRIKAGGNVEVSAKIPHFSFDCKIEMKEVLKKMGLTKAFDSSAADLSGIGVDSRGNLYVSRVIQKTHIDLDNSGTRAAAVTAATLKGEGGIMNAKYYSVNFDRPFIYAIIDTKNGLPIFIGVCDNIG
jgi:serpin B